jgi:hypothetical protein
MAIRDKMVESATPYLQPGETLQCVIGAQTKSQFLILVGYLPFFILNRYRMLAVTQWRILVLDTGSWSQTKARGVVAVLPRNTLLGPGKGVWHVIPAGDEKLRVHRRFFGDMAYADSALSAAPAPAEVSAPTA